jgi:hypothetical protein
MAMKTMQPVPIATAARRFATPVIGMGIALVLACGAVTVAGAASASSEPEHVGVVDAAVQSLTGDVYAEPSRWAPLSLGTLFTEGWDQAWASPPAGSGGAPRQGWIDAQDGVFYRLWIGTYSFAREFGENGNEHAGTFKLYTPLSRRFELRYDVPFITSSKGANDRYHTAAGDLAITPRVILSESQDFTQSVSVALQAPTGDAENGHHVAAVTPAYEFWTNPWQGLVLRGGANMFVPYGHDSFDGTGARNNFIGNFAAGYYLTPHDATPFGDFVLYLASTVEHLTDNRGPSNTTTVNLSPGFRTHMGCNWYLLGAVDVPVTKPDPFDFKPIVGLMKVF